MPTDTTSCCGPESPCSQLCAEDFARTNALAREVFLAIHRGAQIHWIQDYVEYVTETPGATFNEFIQFQVEQEEESPPHERQDSGCYLDRLRGYLARRPFP